MRSGAKQPTNNNQHITDLITGFVDKSGGLAKVEQAIQAMQGVKERGEITAFVQRLGRRPEGAQQLFAAAMMGFTLSSLVYESEQNRQAKGN